MVGTVFVILRAIPLYNWFCKNTVIVNKQYNFFFTTATVFKSLIYGQQFSQKFLSENLGSFSCQGREPVSLFLLLHGNLGVFLVGGWYSQHILGAYRKWYFSQMNYVPVSPLEQRKNTNLIGMAIKVWCIDSTSFSVGCYVGTSTTFHYHFFRV